MSKKPYKVEKGYIGHTYRVVRQSDGKVVEGGFFSREAAAQSCKIWNEEATFDPNKEGDYA